MSMKALKLRAELNAFVRRYFAQRDVLEVETPILSRAGNTDPNIESFHTEFLGAVSQSPATRWLRTSPEYPMKRLLAAGVGDCYELGRVFRNGEAGRRHNPEFTLLEWYRVERDYHELMAEVAEFVQGALRLVRKSCTVHKCTYRELFIQRMQLDPFTAEADALRAPLLDFNIQSNDLTRDDWLNLLLTHCIEPTLQADQLLFIYDYPQTQCALAEVRDGPFPVAKRFEAYLGGHELANGYQELREPKVQRKRFEADNIRRGKLGKPMPPIDHTVIDALADLPVCAGVALGIDRLLMSMLDTNDIRDVLAFSFVDA